MIFYVTWLLRYNIGIDTVIDSLCAYPDTAACGAAAFALPSAIHDSSPVFAFCLSSDNVTRYSCGMFGSAGCCW